MLVQIDGRSFAGCPQDVIDELFGFLESALPGREIVDSYEYDEELESAVSDAAQTLMESAPGSLRAIVGAFTHKFPGEQRALFERATRLRINRICEDLRDLTDREAGRRVLDAAVLALVPRPLEPPFRGAPTDPGVADPWLRALVSATRIRGARRLARDLVTWATQGDPELVTEAIRERGLEPDDEYFQVDALASLHVDALSIVLDAGAGVALDRLVDGLVRWVKRARASNETGSDAPTKGPFQCITIYGPRGGVLREVWVDAGADEPVVEEPRG